jgi:hypothetical protein
MEDIMSNEITGREVFDALITALDAMHSYKYKLEETHQPSDWLYEQIDIINNLRFHIPTMIGSSEAFHFRSLDDIGEKNWRDQ